MPIRRDSKGNIHEEKTERAPQQRRDGAAPTGPVRAQPDNSGGSLFEGLEDGFDQPTRKPSWNNAEPEPAEPAEAATDGHTHVVRRRAGEQAPTAGEASDAPAQDSEAMADPIAGWLVVVAGPGQGNFVTVRYGYNIIGRDASNRIAIDFGDEGISRNKHAQLVYEPQARKFHVAHGEGINVTLLDGSPLMTQRELEDGATLQMGQTKLRFVALCGENFDWDELDG